MTYSHQPKRGIHTIRDFRVGIQTYGDTEDTNKFNTLNNLEVDKPGMLYKRNTQYRKVSTDTDLKVAKKWWNDNLTNDANWLTFGINTPVATPYDKIQLFHPTTFAWVSAIKTFSDSGGTCQIIPSNEAVRFALSNASDVMSRAPGIYVYNHDAKFFLGQHNGTVGFTYENAQLGYPNTWTYAVSQGDYGALPVGYYRYKFVPVYDGIQEMPFAEGNSGVAYGYIHADNDLGNTLKIVHSSLISQFNERIKSIKIYRAHNVENIKASYHHISTIAINTTTGDTGQEETLTNCVGSDGTLLAPSIIMVDEDVNFLTESHTMINGNPGTGYYETGVAVDSRRYFINFYNQEGDKKTFRIEDCGDGWCKLVPQFVTAYGGSINEILDRLWLDPYTIDEGTYGAYGGGTSDLKQVMEHSTGCAGNNVLLDTGASWLTNQFVNWSCTVNSITKTTILGNYNNILKLADGHGAVYATNISVVANEDSADIVVSGDNVTITFTDTGYTDGSSHPLDGIEKVFTNYKYGTIHNGRMFGGFIRLDPDDEAEDHPNWIAYSEFEQYDIMPVTNIIPLVDKRGGKITGMISSGGYLIVFTETGVFRLNVPGIDPGGWEVEHAIETMGCTAPDSITEAEGLILFSNEAGLFALSPHDFRLYELTGDIKQDYLDSGTLTETSLTYDPEKRRVLCKFGSTKTTIYCLDMEQFLANNNPSWTTMTMSANFRPDFISVDENLDVWTFDRYDGTNTQVNQLYGGSSGTQETMSTALRSPWYASKDMDFNTIWRRLQLVIKQTLETSSTEDEDVTINIYLNKDESTVEKTITFNADNATLNGVSGRVPYRNIDYTGEIIELIYRLSRRATFIQFEITTTTTASTGLEIHKIELTEDD